VKGTFFLYGQFWLICRSFAVIFAVDLLPAPQPPDGF